MVLKVAFHCPFPLTGVTFSTNSATLLHIYKMSKFYLSLCSRDEYTVNCMSPAQLASIVCNSFQSMCLGPCKLTCVEAFGKCWGIWWCIGQAPWETLLYRNMGQSKSNYQEQSIITVKQILEEQKNMEKRKVKKCGSYGEGEKNLSLQSPCFALPTFCWLLVVRKWERARFSPHENNTNPSKLKSNTQSTSQETILKRKTSQWELHLNAAGMRCLARPLCLPLAPPPARSKLQPQPNPNHTTSQTTRLPFSCFLSIFPSFSILCCLVVVLLCLLHPS